MYKHIVKHIGKRFENVPEKLLSSGAAFIQETEKRQESGRLGSDRVLGDGFERLAGDMALRIDIKMITPRRPHAPFTHT
jgi:hypothetical protein